ILAPTPVTPSSTCFTIYGCGKNRRWPRAQRRSLNFAPNKHEPAGEFLRLFSHPSAHLFRREPAASLNFLRLECEGPFRNQAINPNNLLASLRARGNFKQALGWFRNADPQFLLQLPHRCVVVGFTRGEMA